MAVEVLEAPATAASPAPHDQVIVLFGATGDLARRKLLPGIFHLFEAGLMPERFALIGASRSALSSEEFVELAHEAVCSSGRRPVEGDSWQRFAAALDFASTGDGFDRLGSRDRRAPGRSSTMPSSCTTSRCRPPRPTA